jgi:hypothetical protein
MPGVTCTEKAAEQASRHVKRQGALCCCSGSLGGRGQASSAAASPGRSRLAPHKSRFQAMRAAALEDQENIAAGAAAAAAPVLATGDPKKDVSACAPTCCPSFVHHRLFLQNGSLQQGTALHAC